MRYFILSGNSKIVETQMHVGCKCNYNISNYMQHSSLLSYMNSFSTRTYYKASPYDGGFIRNANQRDLQRGMQNKQDLKIL